jgi:hypothetical protein
MRVIVGFLVAAGFAAAQTGEEAKIQVRGTVATISVNSPRPVDSIAAALSEHYGIVVNAEDPIYLFADDVRDVTAQVSRQTSPPRRVIISKG